MRFFLCCLYSFCVCVRERERERERERSFPVMIGKMKKYQENKIEDMFCLHVDFFFFFKDTQH